MMMIRSAAAYILLVSVYGVTWFVAMMGRIIPHRPWKPTGRIMVTGTFHNPNWYLSHVTPLARSGATEVILVVDEPQQALDRVRFACPPRWLAKVLSRAGAKALWMLVCGVKYRPDLCIGYHIAPGACSALIAGKLLGRPACYQMTAGPVEIVGGGVGAAESVGASLGRPSRRIEALALAVVRMFDLIVVRGKKARTFLESQGIPGAVAVITGSAPATQELPRGRRETHLVFVGRLAPLKQIDQFISIVAAVSRVLPSARAVIVGDGPMMADLTAKVDALGLAGNIEFMGKRADVRSVLLNSQVFVLTSQSEGLSIAMVEAMAAGTVPVVADIGELGDLVENGVNGYLIEPNCIDMYVERILSILQDEDQRQQLSRRAVRTALEQCGLDVVSRKWQEQLRSVVNSARGVLSQEVIR